MDCTLDHSKLSGLRFCTACGTPLNATSTPTFIPTPNYTIAPNVQSESFNQFASSYPVNTNPDKNKNILIASAGGIALVAIVAIIIGVTAKPAPVSVDASMTLVNQNCASVGWGYFDIPGAQVTITVDGIIESYATYPSYGQNTYLGCKFSTTFYDVPADGSIYSVALASGRRGTISKSRSELESDGWNFGLTLGG